MPRALVVFAVAWASLLGVSVPLEICNTAFLNKHSHMPSLHGLYVAQLAVTFGGLELLPLSINSTPWGRPSKWWSLLGGACGVIAFITVSATPLLGEELLLVTQLVGQLGTFFVLDLFDGTVHPMDLHKFAAFAITIAGVAIDNLSAFSGAQLVDGAWLVHFVGVFFSGVGFALQAKCNGELGRDIGGPARAALISAVVNVVVSSPITAYVAFGAKVPLALDTHFWPLLLLAGFQSAFYIGSMAKLPELLGFTTTYMTALGSQLVCSSIIDALGLAGKVVPFTFTRAISIAMVLFGTTLFNSTHSSSRLTQEAADAKRGV